MSNNDINQMDFKQLRNEVQLLRDELAIMQRKYEDILYNLDNENFSSNIIKEKDDMKAEIKITAEEVSSKVSSDEVQSIVSQTAGELTSKIEDVEGNISSVSQRVSRLSSRMTDAEGVTSEFIQTPYGFTLDGEAVTFTGVIYLTDNDGNKRFSIFHDESQGYPQVFIHNLNKGVNGYAPIVIGDEDSNVYISQVADGNQVATRNWVLEQLG